MPDGEPKEPDPAPPTAVEPQGPPTHKVAPQPGEPSPTPPKPAPKDPSADADRTKIEKLRGSLRLSVTILTVTAFGIFYNVGFIFAAKAIGLSDIVRKPELRIDDLFFTWGLGGLLFVLGAARGITRLTEDLRLGVRVLEVILYVIGIGLPTLALKYFLLGDAFFATHETILTDGATTFAIALILLPAGEIIGYREGLKNGIIQTPCPSYIDIRNTALRLKPAAKIGMEKFFADFFRASLFFVLAFTLGTCFGVQLTFGAP